MHQNGSGMDGVAHTADRDGNPNVFNLNRNDDDLWLNDNNAKPSNRWDADNQFVFRSRKSLLFRPSILCRAVFLFTGFDILLPATKHPAAFLKLFSENPVFFMRYELQFPYYVHEKFERIELTDTLYNDS